MKKNKLLSSIIFLLSALCFLSFIFPFYTVSTESIYTAHLVRVVLFDTKISLFSSLFGTARFGISCSSWLVMLFVVVLVFLSFAGLFKNNKINTILICAVSVLIFCVISAQNLIYSLQYGIKPWNYLSNVEVYYKFEQRIFSDTYLTKQAFFIHYGPGAYLLLISSSICCFFSFLKTRFLFLKNIQDINHY